VEFPPKVSIVIPVFNGSDYLREAVESALAQTYGNVEVLVVNDGSNDGGKSEEIARLYGDRIRYFRKENGGVGSALNLGIREMRGEYFSWLSHDDVYYPGKIQVQMDRATEEKRNVVFYSDYDCIDPESRIIGRVRIPPIEPRALRAALVTLYPVNGCTVLAPKSCLAAVGGFDERLKTTQDYDLWFRMAKVYDFIHIPELLIRSRIHSAQGSLRLSDFTEKNLHFMKCLDELYEEGDPAPTGESRTLFNARAAVVLKKRGFMDAARHAYALSLRDLPWRNRILDVPSVAWRMYFNLYDVRIRARRLKARFRRGTAAK
jgi:glycosyltransferase involved in cell wall biosynthesis